MPESDYRIPVSPLRLQLVKQRDPSGEKYGSDEIDLVAESEGLPARLQIEPAFGVYEHSLERHAAGRRPVRGPDRGRGAERTSGPYGTPAIYGQEVTWQLRPRLFVESADGKARLGLADYASRGGRGRGPGRRPERARGRGGRPGRKDPAVHGHRRRGRRRSCTAQAGPDLPRTRCRGLGDEPAARGTDAGRGLRCRLGRVAPESRASKPGSFHTAAAFPPGGLIGVPAEWFRK